MELTNLKFTNVVSSNVESVAYEGQALFVKFTNGAVYKYNEVPQKIYDELMSADSIGKFLNANVKPNFKFEKVA